MGRVSGFPVGGEGKAMRTALPTGGANYLITPASR